MIYQTSDNSQLLRINAQLTIGWSLKHHSTQPIIIFNRENPQNSESPHGPRRWLDFIALVLTTFLNYTVIKGASIDLYQLFKKSSPQASNQYQNVITYSLTRGQNSNWSQKTEINYECEKCMFETSHFPSLFQHVIGKLGNKIEHSLPMIFKCKNCEKSELQHKIEEDFFKSHDCYVFQPTGYLILKRILLIDSDR